MALALFVASAALAALTEEIVAGVAEAAALAQLAELTTLAATVTLAIFPKFVELSSIAAESMAGYAEAVWYRKQTYQP